MSDEPKRRSHSLALGCLPYVVGFAIGVLAALGATVAWYYVDVAFLGANDREGGLTMFLTFFAFPALAFVFGSAGIAIAFAIDLKR
jgi:hypothetical protein